MLDQVKLQNLLNEVLLAKFEKEFGKDIQIYFLGLNPSTKRLHWLALNEEKQKVLVEQISKVKDILAYNNPLEIPSIPIKDKKNHQEKILIAIAYKNNQIIYTPNAPQDPRSYKPVDFELKLNFCSLLCIPLKTSETKGVLLIAHEKENGLLLEAKNESIKALCKKYKSRRVLEYSQKMSKELQKIINGLKLNEILLPLISELFNSYLENYNIYMNCFDTFITHQNSLLKIKIDKKITNTIKQITHMKENPQEAVSKFLIENSVAGRMLENLWRIEPFLSEAGVRGHFNHMFHVFLLGNVFIDHDAIRESIRETLSADCKLLAKKIGFKKQLPKIDDELITSLWFIISTLHDIAYPIQCTKDWIKIFFKRYFGKADIDLFLGQQQYFSYCNFPKYNNLIFTYLFKKFQSNAHFSLRNLWMDLLNWNLTKKIDHAIVSALLSMDIIERTNWHAKRLKNKKNKMGIPNQVRGNDILATIIGTSIILHNFHKWKLNSFKARVRNSIDQNLLRYKTGTSRQEISATARTLKNIKISFSEFPYAFLLALSDTLQETDRHGLPSKKKIVVDSIDTKGKKIDVKLEVPVPKINKRQRQKYKKGIKDKINEFIELSKSFRGGNGWNFVITAPKDLDSRSVTFESTAS